MEKLLDARRGARRRRSSRTPRSPRARRRHGRSAGVARHRSRHQLLPRQEPRRRRRRRRGAHQRRRAWPRGCAPSPPTAATAKYVHDLVGFNSPPRRDPGGGAAREAAPARSVERAAPRGRGALRRAARRHRRGPAPGDATRQRGRVAPVRGAGRRTRPRAGGAAARRGSGPESTTPPRCTSRGRTRTSGPGPGTSRAERAAGGDPVVAVVPAPHGAQQEHVVSALADAVSGHPGGVTQPPRAAVRQSR